MLQWEAILGMPIATRTAILYIPLLITTSQPVAITSTHHRSLCIQPQVCSTVNTAVVTALCVYPLHAVIAVFMVDISATLPPLHKREIVVMSDLILLYKLL